ncbi:glycosyltransferase [Gymnodinialimonas ceratoperidinii]|uniref:Glycosyltransferase n=1 Tax=Gymnodinialimonas ceratoperidinii TaxID=2856823 RepID=A0A8F6TXD0_9RHOB|nr:glycosyltransferase [Gymnodinialimonas ceratoperidinii]QXT39451.1 glycosyltransferase [Gymnodinialimonas ceratoperidinii]
MLQESETEDDLQKAAARFHGVSGGILVYFPNFAGGGAERVFLRFIVRLHQLGIPVRLVVNSDGGPLKGQLPDTIPCDVLGSRKSFRTLLPLARLLRRERPAAMLSALTGANLNSVTARMLSGVDCNLVICQRNHFSAHLRQLAPLRRLFRKSAVKLLYPKADVITANTAELARDLEEAAGLPPDAVRVIPNPAPDPDQAAAARAALNPHPWFDDEIPVAVAIARLEPAKDYPTMLRAIARLEGRLRLIILGEGSQRGAIERMIEELNLSETVELAGFQDNRFDYLARARVFILSSIREGFPNALIEAVSFGIPSVSTDCAGGGPAALLGQEFPELIVPPGDDEALAQAIANVLDQPNEPEKFTAIAAQYSLDKMTLRFLDVLMKAPN